MTVAAGTPAGTYYFKYQICEVLNPIVCSDTTDKVTVTAPSIVAIPDSGTVNGYTGGTAVANVLANDSLNGQLVNPADVNLSVLGTMPTGITLNTNTGAVTVAAGTPAGTYYFKYQICEVLNPTVCSDTTDKVTVTAPSIVAISDSGTVNGYTGGTAVANVLANDSLNGQLVNPADVNLSVLGSLPTGITLNTNTGAVTVAAGTPAGTYYFKYQICEVLNPTVCSDTTDKVTVTAPSIVAIPDSGTVNGYTGGTAINNVLSNDLLNGQPVIPSDVTLSVLGTMPTGITLNTNTGAVTVATGTPAGTYYFKYQICEVLNPTVCSDTTDKVTVTAPSIVAIPDSGTVNGYTGGTAINNVLSNDLLNGQPVIPSDVTLSVLGTMPTGITLNTNTGAVTVATGTPAGTYYFKYQICEVLNPTVCSDTTDKVTVTAPSIVTIPDSGTVNGYTGGTAVANVLANDSLNGQLVNPADVNLSVLGFFTNRYYIKYKYRSSDSCSRDTGRHLLFQISDL